MNTNSKKTRLSYRREALAATLFFLLLSGVLLLLIGSTRSSWQEEINQRTREISEVQANSLERGINRSLAAARILGAHVQSQQGNISDFDSFAPELYHSLGGITNIQLAPDGIVRHIYPLAGHEKAIGHNLLKDDERRKEAHLAIKTGSMTLAGPFELVQGGTAIIGRQPILIDSQIPSAAGAPSALPLPGREEIRFWGFASALIYLDEVLAMSDLPNLAEKGFNYHLWRFHPDSGQPDSFSGQPMMKPGNTWTHQIELPNSTWFLEITHTGTVISGSVLALLVLLSLLVSGLAGYWLYALLTGSKVLERKVEQQTNEILAINQQLENEKLELKKFSNAVDQSGNAIIITDRQGVIEYVNPHFTQVTGYSAEEAIGHTPSLIRSHFTRSFENQELWETILAGKRWHGERKNRRKDGSFYWSLLNISPIFNVQGEITHFVGVSVDINESKEDYLRVQELAYYDSLTGLANRRYFSDQLDVAIKQLKRSQRLCALLYLDIDHFKQINDTHGHEAGDKLLQIISERLQSCLRETDLAARLGGDEFAVLLNNIQDQASAEIVVNKIIQLLRKPSVISKLSLNVTTSIGITLFNSDSYSAAQLLRQADMALYRAKNEGRNSFRFYHNELSTV